MEEVKGTNEDPGTSSQENNIGGIREKQLNIWKKQHGKIYLVSAESGDGSEPLHFWFRKPDMSVMGPVLKFADSDPLKSSVIFFQNCLLNKENETYKDDVEVMMSIMPHLNSIVEQRKVSIQSF
jgi:hypothetical protein